MVRSISLIGLGCMLLWVSTACAPKHNELSALSERGHRVSLSVSDTLIWVDSPGLNFPRAAELVVRVRDAQGQPVDGIAVVFSVEPDWTQDATFTPAEARTRNGEARTNFQATATGVVHVMARVENVTHRAAITIASRPSPFSGGS
jgi:hypothetical protein